MITREDVLSQAAAMMALKVPPLEAIMFVVNTEVAPHYHIPDEDLAIKTTKMALSPEIAYILDVDHLLHYTIRDEWGDKRQRGRGPVKGSITLDYATAPTSLPILARMMLALIEGKQMDRAPKQWEGMPGFAGLERLPSRANDPDRAAPPRVHIPTVPRAEDLFDLDLDGDRSLVDLAD